MREQIEGLEHHADLGADAGDLARRLHDRRAIYDLAEGRLAVDANDAGLGDFQPVQAAQEGRFPGARGPDDAHHLALGDAQAAPLDHLE